MDYKTSDETRLYNRLYYAKNKEKAKENQIKQYLKHKETWKETRHKHYKNNIERYRERDKNNKRLYRKDILYKILGVLRGGVGRAIKKDWKTGRTIDLLGCSISEFKLYLEKKFTKEMNWNNHGIYWEIDHILPISKFNFDTEIDFKICFRYNNMQPLTCVDNNKKKNKVIGVSQIILPI